MIAGRHFKFHFVVSLIRLCLANVPLHTRAAAAFILWLGLKSLLQSERYFFVASAAACVVLAGMVAIPVVLNAVQGIFWFSMKVLVLLYGFIWYRATFPRYRYDQLMNVGWRWMIPLALANLIATALVRYFVSPHTAGPPVAGLGG